MLLPTREAMVFLKILPMNGGNGKSSYANNSLLQVSLSHIALNAPFFSLLVSFVSNSFDNPRVSEKNDIGGEAIS